MPKKTSRYTASRKFISEDDSKQGFAGLRPREIRTANGVLEHRIKAWERLDHLSLNYYNNDSNWWRILDANPDILYAGDVITKETAGEILIIPKASDK